MELCEKCGVNEAQELHPCPFQAVINDNHDPENCNCCYECERDCRQSI